MHVGEPATTCARRAGFNIATFIVTATCWFALAAPGALAAPIIDLDDRSAPESTIGRLVDVLEDKSTHMTLEDVLAAQPGQFVRSPKPAPNYGFSGSAYWVRARLRVARSPQHRYLELDYPLHDRLELYLIDPDGRQHTTITGDLFPFSERPFDSRTFVFPLEFEKPGEYSLYLRSKTESSMQFPLKLYTPQRFGEAKLKHDALLHGFYGIAIVMILYNLFLYFGIRDSSYLYYVAYVLLFSIYQACLDGFAYQVLWPTLPAVNGRALVLAGALSALAFVLFVRRVLSEGADSRGIVRMFKVYLAFGAFTCVAGLLLPYGVGVRLMSVSGMSAGTCGFVAMVTSARRGYGPARFFAVAFCALLAGVLLMGLRAFGVISAGALANSAMQLGGAIEMVLLSLALGDRVKRQQQSYQQRIEQLNLDLVDKERARTAFFHNTSHELRTPLNGIIAFVDLLRQGQYGDLTARASEQLLKVGNLARSLLGQVNTILDLAKGRRGELVTLPSRVPLDEVVDEARVISEGLLLKAQASGDTHFSSETSWTAGSERSIVQDRERLATVLRNLLGNAFKFAAPDRPNFVKLKLTQRPDSSLEIVVSDTGIGISAAHHDAIFEEYRQVHEDSRRHYEGTGLGLAVTKRFVEVMGGTLTLESEPGKGSTFTVTLPALQAPEKAPSALQDKRPLPGQRTPTVTSEPPKEVRLSRAPPSIKAASALQKAARDYRLLVVDDNAINREVIGDVLGSHGYTVEGAASAAAALRVMEERLPDLVLLDLMMPEMSGEEMLAALRQHARLRNVPVIVLTARASEEDRLLALELGADDYLAKPIVSQELLLRVNNILARLDLAKAVAERAALELALATAQRVTSALGREAAAVPHVEVAEFSQPAESAGGDWCGIGYDGKRARLYIMMGDVTGHGLSSALVTVTASGAAKGGLCAIRELPHDAGLEQCLRTLHSAVNQAVRDAGTPLGRAMTMAFVAIDLASGDAVYLNAGHTEIYHQGQEKLEALLTSGAVLGSQSEGCGAPRPFRLARGDGLFLYTDGLLENVGPTRRGLTRRQLSGLLSRTRDPSQLRTELLAICRELWENTALEDDVSFVTVRLLPGADNGNVREAS